MALAGCAQRSGLLSIFFSKRKLLRESLTNLIFNYCAIFRTNGFTAPRDRMWALQRLRRLLSTPGALDTTPALVDLDSTESSPIHPTTPTGITPPRGKHCF